MYGQTSKSPPGHAYFAMQRKNTNMNDGTILPISTQTQII